MGNSYDARFNHVEGYRDCVDCHNPHSLSLKLEGCSKCHQGVDSPEDFERIRGDFSVSDYDGDRKVNEGIQGEIEGLQNILYQAIQSYAANLSAMVVYDADTPPNFFVDVNENGQLDEGEAADTNQFADWNKRLPQAACNYNYSLSDRGAFIHGGKYIIQLLYDSIEDLDPTLTEKLVRDDVGHFNSAAGAWRRFDEAGEIDGECSRCHSAAGLPVYLNTGDNFYDQPLSSGLSCETCHSESRRHKRYVVASVVFPGGGIFSLDLVSNLYLNCHQGRSIAADMVKMLDGLADDETQPDLTLPDIHGYPAGLTLFGSEAGGAYEYAGRRYAGRNWHADGFNDCVDCHGGHALDIDEEQCGTCHGHRAGSERTKPQHRPSSMACRDCHGMVEVEEIRGHKDYLPLIDYDGDGDHREGLSREISNMQESLYTAIQAYARETMGVPVVFASSSVFFFYQDINVDG